MIAVRFSLAETFDVGADMGTPVVEDYAEKMPFAFTGTLKKFVVVLEPEKLTEEERNACLRRRQRPRWPFINPGRAADPFYTCIQCGVAGSKTATTRPLKARCRFQPVWKRIDLLK